MIGSWFFVDDGMMMVLYDVMMTVLWWWMFFWGGFVPPLKVSGIPFPFTRGQLFGTTLSHHHGYPTSRKLFLWQIIWLDISVTSRSTICKQMSYTKTSRMQHPLICKVPSTSTPNHHRSSPVLQQMELFLVPTGAGSHCYFSAVFHCHPKHRFEITVPQPTTIDISIKYTSILIQPANVDQSFLWLHQMPGWELMPFMVFHCKQLFRLYQ